MKKVQRQITQYNKNLEEVGLDKTSPYSTTVVTARDMPENKMLTKLQSKLNVPDDVVMVDLC